MGKHTARIDAADPVRLVEIGDDLLAVACEACEQERQDVKDARSALKGYISDIRTQLAGAGLAIGASAAVFDWKAILKRLWGLGGRGGLILIGVGLLAIGWLYAVWGEIARLVKALRAAVHRLDDCLERNGCH